MKKSAFAVRVGRLIAQCRHDLEWSQDQLSKATDGKLSPSRIANYEQGTREVGLYEAEVLSEALRVSPCYLLGFSPLRSLLTRPEKTLIEDIRALPGAERDAYLQRIHTLAMAYKTAVPDEDPRLAGWRHADQPSKQSKTPQK